VGHECLLNQIIERSLSIGFLNGADYLDINTDLKYDAPFGEICMKHFNTLAAFILIFAMNIICFAQAEADILYCNQINLINAPVGTKCLTSKGYTFERLKFGVYAEGTGATWFADPQYANYRNSDSEIHPSAHPSIKLKCETDLKGFLPSETDFMRAIEIGLVEAVPQMRNFDWWTNDCLSFFNARTQQISSVGRCYYYGGYMRTMCIGYGKIE
jgi:hypothetical protein